jgi:hypothetical protein
MYELSRSPFAAWLLIALGCFCFSASLLAAVIPLQMHSAFFQ